jgi:hypothetical protein
VLLTAADHCFLRMNFGGKNAKSYVLLHISSTRTTVNLISSLELLPQFPGELDQIRQFLYRQLYLVIKRTRIGTYSNIVHLSDLSFFDHFALMVHLESTRVDRSRDLYMSAIDFMSNLRRRLWGPSCIQQLPSRPCISQIDPQRTCMVSLGCRGRKPRREVR